MTIRLRAALPIALAAGAAACVAAGTASRTGRSAAALVPDALGVGAAGLALALVGRAAAARAAGRRAVRRGDLAVRLEREGAARTRERDERSRGMRLVLEHIAEGLLTIDLRGTIAPERSAAVDGWFGAPAPGTTLPDLVRPHAPRFATRLELGLEALRDGHLPREVCLAQLPARLTAGGHTLHVAYSPIATGAQPCAPAGAQPARLLVILSDATEHLARERAEQAQRELLAVSQKILADRGGCEELMHEASDLVSALERPGDRAAEDQALHTLESQCALIGLERYAELCHELEGELAEAAPDTVLTGEQRARLIDGWRRVVEVMGRLLGDRPCTAIEIEAAELAALAARAEHLPGRELAAVLDAWSREPVGRRLERLGQHAIALARRLGKGELAVAISEPGLRLDPDRWAPLWGVLVHAVRNAIDHGLPPQGTAARRPVLRLEAARDGGRLALTVADNGRGVDWDAVRAAARRAGLPSATREDLVEAMFACGVTTRASATRTSGRGAGLAALRDEVRRLGGTIAVESRPGAGSRFTFSFPLGPREREPLPDLLAPRPARPDPGAKVA